MRRFCLVVLCVLISILSSCAKNDDIKGSNIPDINRLSLSILPVSDEQSAIEMAKGAVIGISTVGVSENNAFVQGVGTGFIVDKSGLALTNQHVINGAARVRAVMDDGSKKKAQVLWENEDVDLAVLKIEGDDFAYLDIFAPSQPKVGDKCLAVGTPLSMQFQHTVTGGIISSISRTLVVPEKKGFTFFQDLIQTDASVNPGNSGGPLIGESGEVLGIVTLKISEAEGIGFAIPIKIARPVVRSFIEKGEFKTPYIGIYAVDSQLMQYYDPQSTQADGLHVLSVEPNGPADIAGVEPGDVITGADDIKIRTMLDLRSYVFSKGIGENITLYMERGTAKVRVEEKDYGKE